MASPRMPAGRPSAKTSVGGGGAAGSTRASASSGPQWRGRGAPTEESERSPLLDPPARGRLPLALPPPPRRVDGVVERDGPKRAARVDPRWVDGRAARSSSETETVSGCRGGGEGRRPRGLRLAWSAPGVRGDGRGGGVLKHLSVSGRLKLLILGLSNVISANQVCIVTINSAEFKHVFHPNPNSKSTFSQNQSCRFSLPLQFLFWPNFKFQYKF